MRMIKQTTTKKEDGRQLVYYWFAKQPVIEVESDKSKVESKKDDSPESRD